VTEDDGHAISFQVLRRGTPVRSATFPAAEKDAHLIDRGSRSARVLSNTTMARRAKRAGESLRGIGHPPTRR
jgi:hypothetical protein